MLLSVLGQRLITPLALAKRRQQGSAPASGLRQDPELRALGGLDSPPPAPAFEKTSSVLTTIQGLVPAELIAAYALIGSFDALPGVAFAVAVSGVVATPILVPLAYIGRTEDRASIAAHAALATVAFVLWLGAIGDKALLFIGIDGSDNVWRRNAAVVAAFYSVVIAPATFKLVSWLARRAHEREL